MKSGVRKSGWPMPRLMMSRPCAISALARASTAKAFSSPMRSKAAMVLSMGHLVLVETATAAGLARFLFVASDLQLGHPHHLEDHRHRPADQQEAIEGDHRPEQATACGWQRVAVAERRVILE